MTRHDGKKYRHKAGYYMVLVGRDHRLSTSTSSYVYEHRLVFYENFGEGPFACYICEAQIDWDTLTIDHLNDIRDDNRVDNLRPACNACNQQRGHWKTRRTTQARAKRYEHEGLNLTARQWDLELGLRHGTFRQRLGLNHPPDKLFYRGEIIGSKRMMLELNGERRPLEEWSKILSVSRSAIQWRLLRGWSVERALTTPKMRNGGRPRQN